MGATLINVRKPALSVFSVISKVCLLFGEGGHGEGRGGGDDGGGGGHRPLYCAGNIVNMMRHQRPGKVMAMSF